MRIFDLFDTEGIKVEDPGLRRYIGLDIKLTLKISGRARRKFGKVKRNVVERLIGLLEVPGHRGKKHKIMTKATGKFSKKAKVVIEALKILQERTKQNPIHVLIKAIENCAPRDEITVIEYGGARYPQAVDCSPLRRLNLALRNIVHGAQDKSFNKRKNLTQALVSEIELAYQNNNESHAIAKKHEMEKQADSAR